MTNRRLDRGKFARVRKTPQGGIRVDAGLTRVGILEYLNPDGSTRREFRSPEEVFRADSLESLAGAPVLDGHSTWVTPETWATHSRGHVVEGTPRQDGELVAADLVVQDAGTLARVELRDLAEISCGYSCDVDPTPGTWKGQHYDCRQINIKYNHVALLPAGAGRAGRECCLRLDALESDAEFVTELTKDSLVKALGGVDDARADLIASIQLLDPGFRADGLSNDYLAGRLDYLRTDTSGWFGDAIHMQMDHTREIRSHAGDRREAPGMRADGTFSYHDVQAAAGEQARAAWNRPAPAPVQPKPIEVTPAVREDENASFTLDEIRARSHANARDAWRGNGNANAGNPSITWERSPGGVIMGRV